MKPAAGVLTKGQEEKRRESANDASDRVVVYCECVMAAEEICVHVAERDIGLLSPVSSR